MITKQIPIEYLVKNAYNVEMLKALYLQIEKAQEATSIQHFGWVADLGPEDGIARETGIVSSYDFIERPVFTYDLGTIQDATEQMSLVVGGLRGYQTLEVGTRVIATTTTGLQRRGMVGTVEKDDANAYWPNVFPVRWDVTGRITYSSVESAIKIDA